MNPNNKNKDEKEQRLTSTKKLSLLFVVVKKGKVDYNYTLPFL